MPTKVRASSHCEDIVAFTPSRDAGSSAGTSGDLLDFVSMYFSCVKNVFLNAKTPLGQLGNCDVHRITLNAQ